MYRKMQTSFVLVLVGVFSLVLAQEEIIDLTHNLDERPIFFGNRPFSLTNITTRKLSEKVTIIANYIQTPEHHGTHMDAPYHWCSRGKRVQEILFDKLSGPGVLLDFSSQASANPDYQITVNDVTNWEAKNGRIPERAIVIVNFGWNQYFGDLNKVFGTDDLTNATTYHFPTIQNETAVFLAKERKINALGVDTPSPDGFLTTGPVHESLLCDHEVLILENVGNVAALPATGTRVYIGALKLRNGGGTPARVFAVKPSQPSAGWIPFGNLCIILLLSVTALFIF